MEEGVDQGMRFDPVYYQNMGNGLVGVGLRVCFGPDLDKV